jgi:DNA gyrase subunit A
VSRALPDVRDGLKPVHRRILYAMWTLGLKAASKYRKSATVVGEVIGKYHPHGDAAVYQSMVRMAQDFALRYMMVNGQGNFGSIDGDNAAAMRYTEAKLQSIAEEMLYDIEKKTVDFKPNYDDSMFEPVVLPSKLPNLLLNGSVGIAVGMTTNIPPHNLNELCDATIHLIDNPDCSVLDLLEYVKGPDFPTGGTIYNIDDIRKAYQTGRASITMRGEANIVESKKGKFFIQISEIPYQVNKASLVEKIAELIKDKRIVGIKDLRDESAREEIRIMIELKKDAYPKKVLNKLFKLTPLQDRFHVNLVALVDGIQPKVLNLKEVLSEHIMHRRNVVRRRIEFELGKAQARAHILEGLKIALDNIDAVIKLIRASKDKVAAKEGLIAKFELSEKQAVAILEMRLQNLANLERQKVEDELAALLKLIGELEAILADEQKILDIIKEELVEVKEKHGDERRTRVVKGEVGKFSAEDLIPDEPTVVMLTRGGYIKRMDPDTFKAQKRGGKGVAGVKTKESDVVEQMFSASTHTDLLFFTSRGRVFRLKAYEVPVASRTAKGQALVNFLQLAPHEDVSVVMPLADLEGFKYLAMVTTQGVIKKVAIDQFEKIRSNGLIAIKLKTDDSLNWVRPTTGDDEIIMVTAQGQSLRTHESSIRAMGRNAAGVRGIRLKSEDHIVGMDIIAEGDSSLQLLVVMANGFGKRTKLNLYKTQGRGGSGIKTANITDKTGLIVHARVINPKAMADEDLLVVSEKGQVIRLPFKSVSVLGRGTQGVRIMRLKDAADSIACVALV